MNSTQLTSDVSKLHNIPFIMSGVIDIYERTERSIGIVLIHDQDMPDINLHAALKEYLAFGIKKVYLLNKNGSAFDKELVYVYPNVICLEFNVTDQKKVNLGLLINTAFQAIKTDLVFLSWTHINPYGMSSCLLQKKMYDFPLCIVPHIENINGYTINSSFKLKKKLIGYRYDINSDTQYPFSLFPCMGVGIYNRKKFLMLKGYDIEISNFQQQLFDFGLRAYCKEMDIRLSPYYRLRIQEALLDTKFKHSSEYHLIAIKFNFKNFLFHTLVYMLKNLTSLHLALHTLKRFYHKKKDFKSNIFPHICKEYWAR